MNSRAGPEVGFTLLEMVCVLAIIGLLAAVLLPSMPRQTSRSRLQGYAIEAATLLRLDRNAAISRRLEVTTQVDARSRLLRSGATGGTVRLPEDVRFETLLPENCGNRPAIAAISFFASGMSCGGVVALMRDDGGYEIRVNWLTGRIEIVSRGRFLNQ